MPFKYILYAIPFLAGIQKESIYKIIIKTMYFSLVILNIKSASSIKAEDIKRPLSIPCLFETDLRCHVEPMTWKNSAGYINFATAPALISRTFDYDPGILPEVAEAIFALRIKNANIGEQFAINFSGHYLLLFTNDRIRILDTYTKKSNVYQYQSSKSNITIGLEVSKGLPRNFKRIIIKEDANGKLYEYAALRSDNISTDEAMLSETLSHPFYQIAGQDGFENKVKVTKSMVFYRTAPSHSRHARCVKSSGSIIEQFMEIFRSGSLACGPEKGSEIMIANHKPAGDLKLENKLIEVDFNEKKYPYVLGFHLSKIWNFNDLNTVAVLVASLHCKVPIKEALERHRYRRAPNWYDCFHWAARLVEIFVSLGLSYMDIYRIADSIRAGRGIVASFFPHGQYPANSEVSREALEEMMSSNRDKAVTILQEAAGETGMAAMADQSFLHNENGGNASQVEIQKEVAKGKIRICILTKKDFKPLPNEIKKLEDHWETDNLETRVYGQYTSRIFHIADTTSEEESAIVRIIRNATEAWMHDIDDLIEKASGVDKTELLKAYNIALTIQLYLSTTDQNDPNMVIGTIYDNDVLVAISIGFINERVYQTRIHLVLPGSLLRRQGAYIGATEILLSEVHEYLFSKGLIDRAKAIGIDHDFASTLAKSGFKHDEQ